MAFVYHVAKELAGDRAGWMAALLAIVDPALIYFTGYIWDTNLFALGVAAILWLTIWLASRHARGVGCLLYGAFLGVLALLNPALTIAYPCLTLWVLARGRRPALPVLIRRIGLVMLGWLIAIAPWTVRNTLAFGELSYIRNGFALELWLGSCPEAHGRASEVYARWYPMTNPAEEKRLLELGELEYMRHCGQLAARAVRADPKRWIRLCTVRALDFWAGTLYSHTGSGAQPWPVSRARLAVTVFFALETTVIVVALLVRRRRSSEVWCLLTIAFLFSLTYCITHVALRYRAPIQPVVVVLAATALCGGRRPHGSTPGEANDGGSPEG